MSCVGLAIPALRVGRNFHETAGFNAWGFVKGLEVTSDCAIVASNRRRRDVGAARVGKPPVGEVGTCTTVGVAEESFGRQCSLPREVAEIPAGTQLLSKVEE